MARVLRRLGGPAVVLFGALALMLSAQPLASAAGGPVIPGGGTFPAPAPQTWSTLQGQAFRAVARVRDGGPLVSARAMGPVWTSTVTSASGPISVAERTVVASDASGRVVIVLAWLGGTQLVVSEMSPSAGFVGQALVLAPGTSRVQRRYPIGGSQDIASAAVVGGTAVVARDAVLQVGRSGGTTARLSSTYGCYGEPQAPIVIGSTFGPLIQAEGIISCPDPETLGLIVGLFEWGSEIGTTSGGTYGFEYALNLYHVCTLVSGSNAFQTQQLWSVNGSLYGTSSGTSDLGCA